MRFNSPDANIGDKVEQEYLQALDEIANENYHISSTNNLDDSFSKKKESNVKYKMKGKDPIIEENSN
jgi:hypothetical protein